MMSDNACSSTTPVCTPKMKPVHGAPKPQDVPDGMVSEPPLPCDFKVGDVVIYTNDYGAEFEQVVRGFAAKPHVPPDCPYYVEPRFVFLWKDAWWWPVKASSLRLKDNEEGTP